ncbi:MAG: amidohydrolase family protein [Gemmatimonadales bacterium]
MKTTSLTFLCAIALTVPAAGQGAGGTYIIRGGTVYTMAGGSLENATVVIRDGRIVAVGADVDVPAEATVINATGLRVYPGLFNAYSQLGLQEINAVAATNDVRELGNFNPQLTAATAVHPASERIPVTRANGVTHVVAAPSTRDGGIAGRASAINLDGWTIEEMIIKPSVGMVLNWPSMQTRRFNFQRFTIENRSFKEVQKEYDEALIRLGKWLEEAREYQRAIAAGDSPPRDLKLEAMSPVVTGDVPLLILADAARDIRNAVKFAGEQHVKMILVSGRDASEEKELLAEKDIPVLLGATQNLPANEDDPYYSAFNSAAELHDAGVRFAMTGWASAGPNPPSRTLAYEAANAVKFGLPHDEALKAITRYPAEILGLQADLGTIEEGKIANLIVTDGDPLEIRTQILHVFIDGSDVSLDNKHKRLYERYRARK